MCEMYFDMEKHPFLSLISFNPGITGKYPLFLASFCLSIHFLPLQFEMIYLVTSYVYQSFLHGGKQYALFWVKSYFRSRAVYQQYAERVVAPGCYGECE